ncbi:hypothetical protein MHU86_14346 [Fragilaria crotonensis]|nr:hypothetical protein MHU86_14346 [Fragilaria crotonensis]
MTTTRILLLPPLLLVVLLTPYSCHGWGLLSQTIAAAVVSSLSLGNGIDQQQLLQSLKPPTEETPQIVLPSRSQDSNDKNTELVQPLVQGLVYLTSPQQSRPVGSDFLILEIRNGNHEGDKDSHINVVVAGAKIPVSRIRFPMQFAMSEKNILPGQTVGENDLLVDARICPSAASCSADEATFKARGIAKMISNLPGSEGRSMRAAASLGLR